MRAAFLAFAAAALAVAPASAQPKAGDRTMTPEQLLAQIGAGVSDEELARAVAAASVHPLGSLDNPVRVGGPDGARAYMARLRCGDGSRPKVGARGPAGIGAFGSVAEAYALDCAAPRPGAFRLVLDFYHDGHAEARTPAGFAIDPG